MAFKKVIFVHENYIMLLTNVIPRNSIKNKFKKKTEEGNKEGGIWAEVEK